MLHFYKFFPWITQTLAGLFVRPFFLLCTNIQIKGYERIKKIRGPLIFAPNHANTLDGLLVPLALPFYSKFLPLFFVVREKKLYSSHHNTAFKKIIFGGWAFRMMGGVEYVSGQKNYAIALARHEQLLKKGGSLCIFPEGTRTKTGEIQTARGGVAYLAQTTGALVVPVSITGAYKTTLRDLVAHKKIVVEFLNPITPATLFERVELDEEGYKKAAEKILFSIKEAQK